MVQAGRSVPWTAERASDPAHARRCRRCEPACAHGENTAVKVKSLSPASSRLSAHSNHSRDGTTKEGDLLSRDGLHQNDLGCRCMAEHIARAVVVSALTSQKGGAARSKEPQLRTSWSL